MRKTYQPLSKHITIQIRLLKIYDEIYVSGQDIIELKNKLYCQRKKNSNLYCKLIYLDDKN